MANSTRRKFLKSAAAIAGSTALAGLTGCVAKGEKKSGVSDTLIHPLNGIKRENIKITDIRVILLSYRLKPEELWTPPFCLILLEVPEKDFSSSLL